MNQGMVTMSIKEVDRLKLLEQVLSKQLTQTQAAKQLGLSRRQVVRLCQGYRTMGEAALVSKREGKPSNNRISKAVRNQVIGLIQSHYHDFGPTLAHEKLTEQHGLRLSRESVRKLMLDAGIWKTKTRNRPSPAQQMRPRRPCFGELVQIDGSDHDWFEGRAPACCLIVFIDDATSKIITLRFVQAECAQAYFDCIYNHISTYGRPLAYYSDRHSIFRVNIKEALSGTGLTQVGRACTELGIELICANSPQAKGRVERVNATLQDRLIKEMRLMNISTLDEANALMPSFIDAFNRRFAKPPACEHDAHRTQLPSEQIIKRILSKQYSRKVSRQLEISFNNVIYQIQTNSPSYSMRGARVTVCDDQGDITILYKGKPLPFKVFDKNNKPNPVVDAKNINKHLKKNKKYKPASDHPWRKYNNKTTATCAA
jgi:transposase